MIFKRYELMQHTAFSAIKYDSYQRSSRDIQNEEKYDKALLEHFGGAKFQNLSDFNLFKVSDSKEIKKDSTTVLFDDPISGTRISLQLSNENLTRLQSKFNPQDFHKRSDDVIRLSGDVEAFVSGWFGDIAYRQNYFGADENKNGKIDNADEFAKLKNGIGGLVVADGIKYEFAKVLEIGSYISAEGSSQEYINKRYGKFLQSGELTLEDALNSIIKRDVNLDGFLRAIGEYASKEEVAQGIDDAMGSAHSFRSTTKAVNSTPEEETDAREIMAKIYGVFIEQEEAISKLKKYGGDISKLTDEERQLLASSTIFAENKSGIFTDEEIDGIKKELEDNMLEKLSEFTGLPKEQIKDSIIGFAKSIDGLQSYNTRIDKELISVVNEIKTSVSNGNVELFDVKI